MTANPPRRTPTLRALSTTLLFWVLGLALVFRFLFGAGVSAGWIAAGTVISVAAACGWLFVQELRNTVECRARRKAAKARQRGTGGTLPSIARKPSAKPRAAGGPLPRKSPLRKVSAQKVPAGVPATITRHRQILGLGSSKPGSTNRRRRLVFSTAWLATRVKKTRRPVIDRLQPVRL